MQSCEFGIWPIRIIKHYYGENKLVSSNWFLTTYLTKDLGPPHTVPTTKINYSIFGLTFEEDQHDPFQSGTHLPELRRF